MLVILLTRVIISRTRCVEKVHTTLCSYCTHEGKHQSNMLLGFFAQSGQCEPCLYRKMMKLMNGFLSNLLLAFKSLLVLRTNRFNTYELYILPILYLYVLYLSQNKLRLLSHMTKTDWFL